METHKFFRDRPLRNEHRDITNQVQRILPPGTRELIIPISEQIMWDRPAPKPSFKKLVIGFARMSLTQQASMLMKEEEWGDSHIEYWDDWFETFTMVVPTTMRIV